MKSVQKYSRSPERRINGHEITGKSFPEDATAEIRQPNADQEATRYLSAATQISIRYAELVVAKVMDEPFRALAPTFGVDVTVVASWALKALRTRAKRDYILAAISALIIADLTVPFLWLLKLIVLLLLLVFAWLAVSMEYRERIHTTVTGKMLRNRFNAGDAPAPPSESDCRRLKEVAKRRDGNLVIFSGHSAFIGSGQRVRHQRILVDVSRGKKAGDDTPTKPDNFTSQDLYAAIVQAFSQETGIAGSLVNIRVNEKLFINGRNIDYSGQRQPDRLRPASDLLQPQSGLPPPPPPASVDQDRLITGALFPTPDARTYVCVEMPGWKGQLVVTLFVRVVHAGESLYIEWTFQVLPPLRPEFLAIDHFHELSRYRQIRASMQASLRTAIPELLRSPYAAVRAWRRPNIAQHRTLRQFRMIERGYVYDYGARRSIREEACGTRRLHYFLARDETMYMLLAEHTLTRAVETFLRDHNVDLDQFEAQVKVIFDNSIKVGNINNSTGVTVGNSSSSTVDDSPEGDK
jgi:hypothetical protein